MEVFIGGREVIASFALLVPQGERAFVGFNADTWQVKLNIVFEDHPDSRQDVIVAGEDDGEYGRLTLKNFNSPLPSALTTPFNLGTTMEGKPVSFLLSGYSVEGFKCLNISFFWG